MDSVIESCIVNALRVSNSTYRITKRVFLLLLEQKNDHANDTDKRRRLGKQSAKR